MKRLWLSALLLAAAVGLGAGWFVWSGLYDISATVQHTQPVYSLLETTMQRSVKRRAAHVDTPPLDDAALVARGALCYRAKCVECHGGPGQAQAEIGRSMQPLPGPLVDASARWRPRELYWITRHGIKMSGMPAWQHRLPDADLWALVAFMQQLPRLTTADFNLAAGPQATGACTPPAPATVIEASPTQATAAPADAERGRAALTQYACSACHRIPGVTGSDVHVGPPLAGIASRRLIAGALPNTPAQMQRWIRDPQSVDPLTTMPNMQVSDTDARHIAAYLATLH